jgi:anti-sigma B factor antagonist
MIVKRTTTAVPTSTPVSGTKGGTLLLRGGCTLGIEAVDGGTRVVVQDTHLDAANAQALGAHLLVLAGRVGGGRLEVDLVNVCSLSDTCVGKLIALDRRLRAAGGSFALLNVRPEVYEVFELTRLTNVLNIHEAA